MSTYFRKVQNENFEPESSIWTRNAVTSLKTGILNENGTTSIFLNEHFFYDDRARVIQTQKQNHLAGQDITTNQYNFVAWLLKSKRQHTATVQGNAQSYTILEEYEYDHAGRETGMHHTINSNDRIYVCEKDYDERDLLLQKKLHQTSGFGGDFLQYVDYRYNIRNWLTDINNINFNAGCNFVAATQTVTPEGQQPTDLFAMKLSYNFSAVPNTAGRFNGNIAAMEWKIGCNDLQAYRFTYDKFDRFTSATYGEKANTNYSINNRYNVSNIVYDLDGNIQQLQRRGNISGTNYNLIDDLTYTYNAFNPSRLEKVNDATASATGFNDRISADVANYLYDKNGNLSRDEHKGMDLSYHYFNLPYQADFGSNQTIGWAYRADGMKLSKAIVGSGSDYTKEYCEGIEYNNGQLEAIYFSEGRATPDGASFQYEYTLTDHLGNARVNFADIDNDGTAEILQENHYYPFGLVIENLSQVNSGSENEYKFNNKELNQDFGFDLYDFGNRLHDPTLNRFTSIDRFAEKYNAMSPFGYAANNPIKFIDVQGDSVTIYFNRANQTLHITDHDHYQEGLPTAYVKASDYQQGGIRDDEGNLVKNQVLVVTDVFTGGVSYDGNVTRDPNRPQQRPIPEGEYDLVDNNADTRHEGWYRLDARDSKRFNDTHEPTGRDGFRFHMGTESWGCVTCDRSASDRSDEWQVIQNILATTTTTTAKEKRGRQSLNPLSRLTVFGKVVVFGPDLIKKE